jgi:hypothetical protein
MKKYGQRFARLAAVAAGAVAVLAMLIAGAGAWLSVAVGVVLGWAMQVALFWALAVWLFPGRMALVYGLGMAGRFAALGVTAFFVVPLSGLAPEATLFSLVAVMFATTLLEPLVLRETLVAR